MSYEFPWIPLVRGPLSILSFEISGLTQSWTDRGGRRTFNSLFRDQVCPLTTLRPRYAFQFSLSRSAEPRYTLYALITGFQFSLSRSAARLGIRGRGHGRSLSILSFEISNINYTLEFCQIKQSFNSLFRDQTKNTYTKYHVVTSDFQFSLSRSEDSSHQPTLWKTGGSFNSLFRDQSLMLTLLETWPVSFNSLFRDQQPPVSGDFAPD